MNHQILSDPELRRFKDQISIPLFGIEGQLRLKNSRVAVIGAGGIGSAVLQLLSSVGVGYMGIIDYRPVEEDSMQSQTLFGGNDLGKLKTILSKERLQVIFPFVNYGIINLEITNENANRIFSDFDLIIDTTNNSSVNAVVFETCQKLALPAFFGRVEETKIKVTAINFKNSSKLPFYNEVFDRNFGLVNHGRISLAYHFAALFLSNEVIKFIISHPSAPVTKQISFDLLGYQLTIG